MDLGLWLPVLFRAVSVGLAANGKADQAALLNDAASVLRKGGNIDDIMQQYADSWEQNGEPSFDEIAETRRRIQERL